MTAVGLLGIFFEWRFPQIQRFLQRGVGKGILQECARGEVDKRNHALRCIQHTQT